MKDRGSNTAVRPVAGTGPGAVHTTGRPAVGGRPLPGAGISRRWPGAFWGTPLGRRRGVLLACALTFVVHLLYLSRELSSDEGGFLMVARHWRASGPYLYGAQWVDRPPGLMVVFGAASALGPFGPRLVAAICATLLVAAGAWAARSVRGAQAAAWAAWTAFALVCSPMLATYQLNGEIIAAAFALVAVAAALHAVYRTDSATVRLLLGVPAGAAAAAALLVKQNFVDGLAFVGVLLAAGLLLRRSRVSHVLATGAGFLVGAAVPLAAAVLWAGTRGGVQALVYATYGFRAAASEVVADGSWHAPEDRLLRMLALATASGLVLLVAQVLVSQRRALVSRSPLVWAVTAAAALELLGVALGVNYWPHYLIGLIPMVVLAAGLACRSSAPGHRWTRLAVLLAVTTTVVAAPVGAAVVHSYRSPPYLVGRWVAGTARHGDTVVVPFSHPNVIEASGLTSPYPYSWSLPVRTLDPGLVLLTRTLDRRHGAPTWVVRWDGPHAWGLDPRDRLGHALAAHYREVAVACGHPVWLHRGLHRSLAPLPRSCP